MLEDFDREVARILIPLFAGSMCVFLAHFLRIFGLNKKRSQTNDDETLENTNV